MSFYDRPSEKESADLLKFQRYCAKGGVEIHAYLPRVLSDALKTRAGVRDIIGNIDKKRDGGAQNISDDEADIYSSAIQYVGELSQRIDMLSSLEAKTRELNGQASSGSPGWYDVQSGRKVRVLNADEKFSTGSEIQFGSGTSMYGGNDAPTLGEIVRGMALGGNRVRPEVRNALSEGTDSAGGYTVPAILLPQLIDRMRSEQTVIRAGAKTIMLDSMKTTIARLDTDPVAAWRNENAAIANSDAVFSGVVLQARTLAVIVQISMELLEDSVNLSEGLQLAFARSFASELDRVALFGSGTAPEPRGISNTSGIGSVSMGTNGLALSNFDPFIDAWQAMKDANSTDPTAAILAPRTAAKVAKLKDLQNQPLRKPPLIEQLPIYSSTSVPINQTQGSSSVASSIIMGDFTQLLIGIRTEMRIQLLRELYAANGQYAFMCYLRADIGVEHPASFCKVIGVL